MPTDLRLRHLAGSLALVVAGGGVARADVSALGDFQTSYTIEVPTFRGQAPSVQLAYSANGGNGLAGVGWTLSASSAIVRTGARGGVAVGPPTAGARFELDGEELIACAPGSTSPSCTTAITWLGSSAGFYSTRVESFRRLQYTGGTSPWKIWNTDGSTATYNTYDSGKTWLLSRTQDTHGNGIDYNYACANGACELSTITYGSYNGNVGAEVRFFYENRPDMSYRATGGGFALGQHRLRSVTVRVGGQLARAYALTYTQSAASGRSLLSAVQQFPRDAVVNTTTGAITAGATPPKPAMTFATASQSAGTGWQFGELTDNANRFALATIPNPPARAQKSTSIPKLVGWFINENTLEEEVLPYQSLIGDFDGDGRVDQIVGYVKTKCTRVGFNGVLARKGYYATIPGATVTTAPLAGNSDCTPTYWVGDIDGDHRDDVLFKFRDKLTAARLGSGGSFQLIGTDAWTVDPEHCELGDVDGDSRGDLVCHTASGLTTARGRGDGTFEITTMTTNMAVDTPMTLVDVNADGFTDVAFAPTAGTVRGLTVLRSDGDGTYTTEAQTTTWPAGSKDILHGIDLDTDGLGDLYLARAGTGGDAGVALSVAGDAAGRFELHTSTIANPMFGDVNADGKIDLVAANGMAWLGYGTGSTSWAAGLFSTPTSAFGGATCTGGWRRTEIADTDGDGRSDLVCLTDDGTSPILGGTIAVVDTSSHLQSLDTHRWMQGDFNGDGRGDYAYVHAKNPGLGVVTVLDGTTPARVTWSATVSVPAPFDDPAATRWMVADVGGPAGRADGIDDLVLVDSDYMTPTDTLRVYTLLGNGNGTYTQVVQRPWLGTNGSPGPYPDSDLQNFFPLDVDGDGDQDLVKLGRSSTGVRVDILRASGSGTWTASTTDYFTAAAPRFAAVTDFRPMEINGDGLVDLVNVQSGGGMAGTIVRSLRSNGDGTFTELTDLGNATHVDVSRWLPADMNGDGLADLVHVRGRSGVGGFMQLDTLVGRGDGTYLAGSYATSALPSNDPELTHGLEATTSVMPADLDGDGLTDLLHVSRYRTAAGARRTLLVTLRNPGVVSGPQVLPPPAYTKGIVDVMDTIPWGWRRYRDPARLNSPAFAVIDDARAETATLDLPSDRITQINNGNGGTTSIAYKALVGSRAYMPSGVLPTVTSSVTRTDNAYSPAVSDVTTYEYMNAQWSDVQQRQLGFQYITVREPRRTAVTLYATDEACATTPLQFATYKPNDQPMTHTINTLVAPGTGPFTCLVQQQARYACEGVVPCELMQESIVSFDAYGNAVLTTEHASFAPTRQTTSPVYANAAAYIVDRPAFRGVQDIGGTSTLLSMELYEYDSNTTYNAPPGALGELRRSKRWDSVQGAYITTEMLYTPQGLLGMTTSPEGIETTIKYDGTYRSFPANVCDPLGCVDREWDFVLGTATVARDANGQETNYTYNPFGEQTEVLYADGSFVRTQLLGLGTVTGPQAQRQRTRIERSDNSAGDGVVWKEQFVDGWGRTYRVEHEGGAAQTTSYLGTSNLVAQKSEVFDVAGAPDYFTTYTYDALGRSLREEHPDGTARQWTYSPYFVEHTDENGQLRKQMRDGAGNVTRVFELVSGVEHETLYSYDAARRMVFSSDELGNQTLREYDTLGRLVAEQDPDRGLRAYTYRTDGKVLTSTDAKNQQITFTYDAHGRAIERNDITALGATERTVHWTYDALPGVGQLGYSHGRVVRIDDDQPGRAQLSTTYTYDALGRVTDDETCIDGDCKTMNRSYDAAGRIATLTYPDGEAVVHAYDSAGRLQAVGPYVTDIQYTHDGLVRRIDHGNGVKTTYKFDEKRRWAEYMTVGKTSTIYSADYTRDATGRITNLVETAPTNADTFAFTYDELGRLTNVAATNTALDRQFAYDGIGRMAYHSQLGDYHYGDPSHPHAMTSTDYGAYRDYDANGNVTGLEDNGRAMHINWSVDDRPIEIEAKVGTYQMAYDVTGRRVKKDGPNDAARYFGNHVAVENGTVIKYYFAGDRLVARNDGNVAYYHDDHTHATRVETDAFGKVDNAYQYDVFGVSVAEQENFDDNIGLGTEHGDQALGLTYLNARYYDPVSARFLSADSYVRDIYSPQSMDRYAYVENDPVNYYDPTGHLPVGVLRLQVEIMKERRQAMIAVQMAFEAGLDFCGSAPEFCGTPKVQRSIVGEFARIEDPTAGFDPGDPFGAWDPASGVSTGGGGGGGGAGGGGGEQKPQPIHKTVLIDGPGAYEQSIEVDGATIEFTVMVDANGTITMDEPLITGVNVDLSNKGITAPTRSIRMMVTNKGDGITTNTGFTHANKNDVQDISSMSGSVGADFLKTFKFNTTGTMGWTQTIGDTYTDENRTQKSPLPVTRGITVKIQLGFTPGRDRMPKPQPQPQPQPLRTTTHDHSRGCRLTW